MSNQYPGYPHPPYGHGAQGPGMPPGPPYAPLPNQPYRPMARTRPPLTRTQKRAALWSGALGFPIMTLGFTIVVCVLGWSAIAGIIAGVLSQAEYKDSDTVEILDFLNAMGEFWWVFVLALVVGLLIWGAGYGSSIGIAKAGHIKKATGMTWAGLGIASFAGMILMWLGQIVLSVGGFFVAILSQDSAGVNVVIYGTIYCVLSIVIWAATGALSWWWMAHCMRDRHPAQRYAGEPYFI
ncbi:hypothetical protein [Paramicrobacterium fandaimingii]|uniref:hypothetical protein n=1 Tax=Paramicrobacterium fandaimingii TaxID=2708079 RepID=UPI0014201328|nr:hypothetical protein [Microbacterium fandaimingii]